MNDTVQDVIRQSQQLTVVERVSLALNTEAVKKEFIALAEQSKSIVAIVDDTSYQEAQGARMRLVKARTTTQKRGKGAREDAQAFSKGVIAGEQMLLAIIEPEEKRLQALQSEWDAIAERKRQAEVERVQNLMAGIEAINQMPLAIMGRPSDEISCQIIAAESINPANYSEFVIQADEARTKVIAALRQLHAGAVAQENAAAAEKQRIADERADFARRKAELEERERKEASRIASESQERAKADAKAKAKLDAAEAASRAQIALERAAAQRIIDEAARVAKVSLDALEAEAARERAAEAARKAEIEAAATAEATVKAQAQAETERAQKAENERLEAEKRQALIVTFVAEETEKMIQVLRHRIGTEKRYAGIARAIDKYLIDRQMPA